MHFACIERLNLPFSRILCVDPRIRFDCNQRTCNLFVYQVEFVTINSIECNVYTCRSSRSVPMSLLVVQVRKRFCCSVHVILNLFLWKWSNSYLLTTRDAKIKVKLNVIRTWRLESQRNRPKTTWRPQRTQHRDHVLEWTAQTVDRSDWDSIFHLPPHKVPSQITLHRLKPKPMYNKQHSYWWSIQMLLAISPNQVTRQ